MGKTYTVAPRVIFTPLDTGEYVLTLLEVVEQVRDKDYLSYKKGDIQLEFHWEVTVQGADNEERRSWASVPKTWSKKAPFTHIAVALGLISDEEAAEQGASIDFELALGKRCLGTIVRKMKEGTQDWTDEITAYALLTRIPPSRPRRPAAPIAPDMDEGDIPF